MAKPKSRILNTENKPKHRIQNLPLLLGVLDTAICNKVDQ